MSTAKRLVLSLRGRKESHTTAGTSSTRLVSATSLSPGHELDEIAVVSGSGDSCHILSYGSLSQPNGPSYTGKRDRTITIRWLCFISNFFLGEEKYVFVCNIGENEIPLLYFIHNLKSKWIQCYTQCLRAYDKNSDCICASVHKIYISN